MIVGVAANAPVVFYKRTGPATWEAYRTTTDKGASLSNGSAGCALDPDGRYAVAVIAGKGLVFTTRTYNANAKNPASGKPGGVCCVQGNQALFKAERMRASSRSTVSA